MADQAPDKTEQYPTKLTLIGIFLTLLGLNAVRESRHPDQAMVTPFELLLLGLAAYRGGRLVAYDDVGAPLRAPFTRTHADGSGAGQTVDAAGNGPRAVIGELISCPTCAGTWITAGLVYGLRIWPVPVRLLLTILATTGIAELLDGLVETLSWTGRAAREQVGTQEQRKKK